MHVKIRKRIGNPTLYNAKINYSPPRLMSCRTQKMEADVANGFLFPPSIICFSYDVATTIANGADVCSSPFLFPRIS